MSVLRVLEQPTDKANRLEIYRAVHKGLRLALTRMLTRIGAHDFSNEPATRGLLGDLASLLKQCANHLHHEDVHIHAALEQRLPGAASLLDHQHAEHATAFEGLRLAMEEAASVPPAQRESAGHALYLRFAAFVADDFVHMDEEETVTSPLLQQLFSDDELMAIQGAILGSIPPSEMVALLKVMIPAMNRQERVGMLGGMRASAPAEVFSLVMSIAARPNLSDDDWQHLTRQLDLAA